MENKSSYIKLSKIDVDLKSELQKIASDKNLSLSDFLKLELQKMVGNNLLDKYASVSFNVPVSEMKTQLNRLTNSSNKNTEILVSAIQQLDQDIKLLISFFN